MPTTSQPRLRPASTTARMTALSPGASPPPVDTAMRLIGCAASPAIRRSVGRPTDPVSAVRGPASIRRRTVDWVRDDRDMFDLDDFLDQCQAAGRESEPRTAVRDVVQRAIAAPAAMGDVLQPAQAGITLLHHADDLTVLHVVWAPGMSIYPHDHRMWAVIGIYEGQEDNAFFRRSAPGAPTLTESGGKQL